jgi:hypothetical protein
METIEMPATAYSRLALSVHALDDLDLPIGRNVPLRCRLRFPLVYWPDEKYPSVHPERNTALGVWE